VGPCAKGGPSCGDGSVMKTNYPTFSPITKSIMFNNLVGLPTELLARYILTNISKKLCFMV